MGRVSAVRSGFYGSNMAFGTVGVAPQGRSRIARVKGDLH